MPDFVLSVLGALGPILRTKCGSSEVRAIILILTGKRDPE